MTGQRKRGARPTTAGELIEQLARDPEYQSARQTAEAERKRRVAELRAAEQPILSDLRKAGIFVSSVWDLVNSSEPYPKALPILLRHLKHGGYPDRVMESVARALAVRPASLAWNELRGLYLVARGPGEMEGLAVALAASATAEHLDDLLALLDQQSRGDTRLHFLRAIRRVGGPRGREVLQGLRDDRIFGAEARSLTKTNR